jgi:hypothetical protein
MAATKRTRANLEFLLVKAELKGVPEKGLCGGFLRRRPISFQECRNDIVETAARFLL